jgi:hypothetical protein
VRSLLLLLLLLLTAATQSRLAFSSSETASEASRSYALSHRRGYLLQIPPTMLCALSRTTRTRTNAGRLHLRRPCSAMIARTHRRRPLTSPVHLSRSRTEQPSGLPAMWWILVSWIRQQASSVLTATVSCLLSTPAINVQLWPCANGIGSHSSSLLPRIDRTVHHRLQGQLPSVCAQSQEGLHGGLARLPHL